jgi:hypothetical protein
MMVGVESDPDVERLARTVYLGARNGAVDREAAFDLASLVLEEEPDDAAAAELARLSMDDSAGPRLAAVALAVSAGYFSLGFDEEPGWLAALEDAMDLVNADMRASGLPGTGRLEVYDWSPNAYAVSWDGETGTSGGVFPPDGSDPVSALVAVADDAQDAVMHTIWGAWPVCPAHGLGVHARELNGTAVWWCEGAGGHVAAVIGEWGRG